MAPNPAPPSQNQPPPASTSDDSALESMSSSDKNSTNSINISQQQTSKTTKLRPKITRPTAKDLRVDSDDLRQAALQMRSNNFCLLSRSLRTELTCFDDLDTERFESRTDHLINFISNGVKKCNLTTLRPVSILWPDTYEKLVDQIAQLDAYLLNVQFRENPVDWMLERNLTAVPTCRQCKDKMSLLYEANTVRWQCQKTQACSNYFMPVQRPSFFSNYENIALDKLLFAVYFWSTCTPSDELYNLMKIDTHILNSLWKRIQNVCRNLLEKRYPRLRLTNNLDQGSNSTGQAQPIDLISVKLRDVYIVCAKHPGSNLVRLGFHIPKVSLYSFVDLTESWFAHGAEVRVSESKFLDLTKRRSDLKVNFVSRLDMVSKNGRFNRDSAFGYIVCQLSHVLKDYDSSTLSRESLKLILAETEWRELYGTTPLDAFTNIVNHIAEFGETSDWYSEPSLPTEGEETSQEASLQVSETLAGDNYVWAEKYFYSTVDPVDSDGNVICRFSEPPDLEKPPHPDVRVRCHSCLLRFESFDFSLHMIAHVEANRREHERKEYRRKKLAECKHCFKTYQREHITIHSTLFRSHFHVVKYGCRICCIQLKDRADYLQHMRMQHFEHETPYRCPSCKFCSSFQRDVFIHFQEEHRHSMIILCPLCLRSFTVAKPQTMTLDGMNELSQIVYNHLSEHYITSKGYTCNRCCLCFTDRDKLRAHKRLHHNPCEIRPTDVKLEPFIVTQQEEEFCVKALPVELFIANKRPNLALDPNSALTLAFKTKLDLRKQRKEADPAFEMANGDSSENESSSSSDGDAEVVIAPRQIGPSTSSGIRQTGGRGRPLNVRGPNGMSNTNNDDSDDDDEYGDVSFSDSDPEDGPTIGPDGTIHVRGFVDTKKFLHNGRAALKVVHNRKSSTAVETNLASSCSSQRLIEYLSRMKQADGILPNQSVILTPRGRPAKCCECFQFVTADHYVAKIDCKNCCYVTHCPRAAISHNTRKHQSAQ